MRVPYDALAGGDPIRSRDIHITGIGFGDQPFSGNFAEESRNIEGASPENSPRLNLVKTIVDLADDDNDGLVMVDDPELGLIPAAGPGDVLTLLLVAANYGGLPAERISIKDRVPEGCALVPDSVRVKDVSAGALLKVDGRTLNFQLGDLKAGELVVVTYQFSVLKRSAGGPLPDSIIESVGAEVASMSLRASPGSSPERIPIKIARPVELQVEHTAMPGDSAVNEPTTFTMKYSNVGNRIARNVVISNPVPEGTNYREGSAIIHNPKPGQTITQPDPQTLVFNLGDVAAKSSGVVELTVDVNDSVLDLNVIKVANRPYFGSIAPSSGPDGAKGPNFGPADGETDFIREESNPIADASIPRLFLARVAPQSVKKSGVSGTDFSDFEYTIIVGNMSDLSVPGAGVVRFEIPEGADFLASSEGGTSTAEPRSFLVFLSDLVTTGDGTFPGHSAAAFKVVLRVTGEVGKVIKDATCYLQSDGVDGIYVPAAVTLIIEGDANSPTNQVEIAGAQLGALGLDAAVAMLDDRVAKAVGRISEKSANTRIGGASYVQMTNGTTLIPLLGADQMVAIGPASLIGLDGATLIGNDGGTLVAAGAGNLITFNGLIGLDGGTLVGQDGSTIMSKIRLNDPDNLVAAGAGNLVAAGGGNLIGLDGASLVGNDGGSLATIASFLGASGASLIAAASGDLLGPEGLGLITADFANVVINDPEALVAAGGGNFVTAGGATLIGLDHASAVSKDASLAYSIGADGSITVGGGGAPLVAAGAGN